MVGIVKFFSLKRLQNRYDFLSKQAMLAQRSGDIKKYSLLTAEAEKVWQQLQKLKQQ